MVRKEKVAGIVRGGESLSIIVWLYCHGFGKNSGETAGHTQRAGVGKSGASGNAAGIFIDVHGAICMNVLMCTFFLFVFL